MNLTGFRHKGLKRLYASDDAKGVPARSAEKLRNLLFVLKTANGLDQVAKFPGWKLHPLRGELEGFWS
jgi:toxin HigB-1